jgi:hypothetical protein
MVRQAISICLPGCRPAGHRLLRQTDPALQKGEYTMQLSAPKQITWWIALALVVIGFIAQLVTIPVLSGLAFWIVFVGAVLLLVASFLPNL